MVWNYSLFSAETITRFRAGKCFDAYRYFGAHALTVLEKEGFYFAVWAPNATYVSVVGDFNGWKKEIHPLYVRLDSSGIWEGFIPALHAGLKYKFHITGAGGEEGLKADPFAFYSEMRPNNASVLWNSHYHWGDDEWLSQRKHRNGYHSPWSVYEVHPGSWMRPDKDDPERFNSYDETVERLIPYCLGMGFTHIELMPVMEYPYDASWGYQLTGYFAPTARYGEPEGLKRFIDACHRHGIGVLLDWVPSHFPGDAHGLYRFDGAHTYEYGDMQKGYHPDWNSYIFNYARGEVRSFLMSSAHYWLHEFHADGLRVDAVNSIVRLDFGRAEGSWKPNDLGTNENLEASEFLRNLNKMVSHEFEGVHMIAEDASDWPGITTPVNKGGYGFSMKWMMGWMHDSFRYFKTLPADRPAIQDTFTFSMMYFTDERFMLPLSHDEVVHGKSPMIYKMPGNEQEKFANLRLLYTYMYTHPGAKLLFMGNEFGQTSEWNFAAELDWPLLQYDYHNGVQECVRTLNHIYRGCPAMFELQFSGEGFEWIELNRREEGIIAYRRKGRKRKDDVVVILNVSGKVADCNGLKVKGKQQWEVFFNSDSRKYAGSGMFEDTLLRCEMVDKKRRICEIFMPLAPLSGVMIRQVE